MLDDEPETDELSYASIAFGLKLPKPAGSIYRSAGIWMDSWALERRDQLQQDHLGEEQQIKETKRARRKKARMARLVYRARLALQARQAELMQHGPGVHYPKAHSLIVPSFR